MSARNLLLPILVATSAGSMTLSVAAVRQTSAALKSADDEADRAVRYRFEYQHVLRRLDRLEASRHVSEEHRDVPDLAVRGDDRP